MISGTCKLGAKRDKGGPVYSILFISWNSLQYFIRQLKQFYTQVEKLLVAEHFTMCATFSSTYITPTAHLLLAAL